MWRSVAGVGVGGCVYLITNPYIVINAVSNREVLRSNFGNSLAMYEVSRVGEGLVRVLELTIEGATLPVLVLGAVALLFGVVRRNAEVTPLAVVGGVLFLQFVLIGAGKPGEYGRFGVFTNTALAIGAACVIAGIFARSLATGCRQRGDTAPSAGGESPNPPVRGGVSSRPSRAVLAVIVGLMVVAWTGARGGVYLWNFYADTTPQCTRPLRGQGVDTGRHTRGRSGGTGAIWLPADGLFAHGGVVPRIGGGVCTNARFRRRRTDPRDGRGGAVAIVAEDRRVRDPHQLGEQADSD